MAMEKNGSPASRTKTFTGCWTCRARKIKCDLTRPACIRCVKANLKCEGYTIKLRWAQGDGAETSTPDDDTFQRRTVDFVEYPPGMIYETYEDMDDTLAKLHAPTFQHNNQTVSLGPFGVFEGVHKRKLTANGARAKKRGRKSAKDKDSSSQNGDANGNGGASNPGTVADSDRQATASRGQSVSSGPGSAPATRPGSVAASALGSALGSSASAGAESGRGADAGVGSEPEPIDGSLIPQTPLNSSNGLRVMNDLDGMGDLSNVDDMLAGLPLDMPLLEDPLGMWSKEPLGEDLSNYQSLKNELTSLLAADSYFDVDLGESAPMEFGGVGLPIDDTVSNAVVAPPTPHDSHGLAQGNGPNNAQTATNQPPLFQSSLFASIPGTVANFPCFDNKFGLPTNSLYFTPQARYLLDHYLNHVLKIMMVIIHPINPWKTIYLPRALGAVGELISVGHTASSKNALLHALMAVSACHLQSKFPEGSFNRKYYTGLSLQLKAEAYKWFSECLTKNFARQKYKDIITAVLSLISIDVIAGSASDCRVHLAACKSIINMRCRLRPKMSNKAVILHRIAGVLNLLQTATDLSPSDVNVVDKAKDFNDQWLNLRLEDFGLSGAYAKSPPQDDGTAMGSLAHMNNESDFEQYWLKLKQVESKSLSDDFYQKELVSTVVLYGVPDSLVLLFARMAELTKQVLRCRYREEPIPKDLLRECADLETTLVSWESRYDISKHTNLKGDFQVAAMHHIMAFHQAMIIYHYRLVRDVNPAVLQSHVGAVFDSLEHIQALNAKTRTCVPLMFPAFVAACEITTDRQDLRDRYTAWLGQLMVDGLGNYETVRKLVPEVWRRRDAGQPDIGWWEIKTDWNMDIMLS